MYKITHDLLEDIQTLLLAGTPQEKMDMAIYLRKEYTNPDPDGTQYERPQIKNIEADYKTLQHEQD